MPSGQALAAVLAIVLLLAGVITVVRGRWRRSAIAWALVATPIPAGGLALYALRGGPLTQSSWLLWVVGLMVLAGLLAGWRVSNLQRSWLFKRTVTLDEFHHLNSCVLAMYACIVMAISAFVYFFEPAFAIAYVVACGIWVAIWIPRGWRRTRFEFAAPVGAPPARVYAFLIDPATWRRYQTELEEVTVHPAGVLGAGSEITIRRQHAVSFTREAAVPISVSIKSVVTAMVPDVSYSTRVVGGEDVGTTEVRPSSSGSTITIRSDGVVSRVEAILGLTFERPGQLAERRRVGLQNLARLDALLSAPAETQ